MTANTHDSTEDEFRAWVVIGTVSRMNTDGSITTKTFATEVQAPTVSLAYHNSISDIQDDPEWGPFAAVTPTAIIQGRTDAETRELHIY